MPAPAMGNVNQNISKKYVLAFLTGLILAMLNAMQMPAVAPI